MFDYSWVARQQRCTACINFFASAEICMITIRSWRYLFFHVWCRIEYLYNFRSWIAAMQSHEQSELRRYLYHTKECRDIARFATAIHQHYEKMYPGGILPNDRSQSGALQLLVQYTARYDGILRAKVAKPRNSSWIAKSRLRDCFIPSCLPGKHNNAATSASKSASTFPGVLRNGCSCAACSSDATY